MKRQGRVFMWLDNASDIDILFYEPYARIIADIAKNEQYNPLTVGVFGLWGAGKSTLLKLIGEKLKSQDGIICVTINAWMFESYDDAKTAIMEALLQELKEEVPVEETKKKLGKLIKRVDWFKLGTKAISTLAPVVASVATGNPLPMLLNVTGSAEEIGNTVKNAANSIQSLKDEYWKEEDASNDESTINNIRKFREEFSDALKSDDIKNVVVMIDDLDRCRPERIIEILEVIKLFLSVDRTTFIIAADENVIKYSIREKYPPMNGFDVELDKEYIEKIIQLPIYIPELSAKDIQNYLLLLVTQSYLEQESFKHLIDKIFEETGKNELLAPRIENQNNQFTKAILFAKVPFELTTKEDRMRTCYMQACLAYVNFEGISNSDIRKIFGLGEKEKAKASRLLTSAVEGGYIKVMDPDTAPRYKKYIPYWA